MMNFICRHRAYHEEQKELMDLPQPKELMLEDLRFIGWINRYFGSHAQMTRFLEHHSFTGRPAKILDCATGFGDIPRLMSSWFIKKNQPVEITATDINPVTLQIARENTNDPVIGYEIQNLFNLSYPDQSFDLVMCHMALHHFSRLEVIAIFKELWRVTSGVLYCTDIVRADLALLGASILIQTTNNPISRNDAIVSARRAFTGEEFKSMALDAGLKGFKHEKARFFRQGIIVCKEIDCPE